MPRTEYWKDPLPQNLGSDFKPLEEVEEEEELSFFGKVADVGMAIPRGVGSALESTAEIGNIFGFDYDVDFVDDSKTMLGGAVQGISNFVAGFIPFAGWIGKGGKIASALKLGGMSKASIAAMKAAGKTKKAYFTQVGAAATSGALADFTIWDGHDARLSDLIQQYPSLQNPVTAFLAADEDDPEIIGRLKTAIEGIGAGIVVDAFILGIRRLRRGKRVFEETKSEKKALEAMDEEVSPDDLNAAAFDDVGGPPVDEAAARGAADLDMEGRPPQEQGAIAAAKDVYGSKIGDTPNPHDPMPIKRGEEATKSVLSGKLRGSKYYEDLDSYATNPDYIAWEDAYQKAQKELSMQLKGDVLSPETQAAVDAVGAARKAQEVGGPPVDEVAAGGAAGDYRGQHQPSKGGPPLHDLTEGDLIPSDVYDRPDLYIGDSQSKAGLESIEAIRVARGNPEATVTIFRSAPKGVTEINPGDWVSLSETYAKEHGMHGTEPSKDWPIISKEVPAKDVRFEGNDLNEFGYFPEEVSARGAAGEAAKELPDVGDMKYRALAREAMEFGGRGNASRQELEQVVLEGRARLETERLERELPIQPKYDLDEAEMSEFHSRIAANIELESVGNTVDQTPLAGSINLKHFEGDAQALLDAAQRTLPDIIDAEKLPWEEVPVKGKKVGKMPVADEAAALKDVNERVDALAEKMAADTLNGDPVAIKAAAQNRTRRSVNLDDLTLAQQGRAFLHQLTAERMLLQEWISQRVAPLVREINIRKSGGVHVDPDFMGIDTKVLMDHALNAERFALQISASVNGGKREAGLILRSMGMPIPGEKIDLTGLKELDEWGAGSSRGRAALEEHFRMVEQLIASGERAALEKQMGSTKFRKMVNMLNQIFVQNILAGAKTLTTNVMGPLMVSAYRQMENFMGGSLTYLSSGDKAVMRRAVREFGQLFSAVSGAARSAKQAFVENRILLDDMGTIETPKAQRNAINPSDIADVTGLKEDGWAARAIAGIFGDKGFGVMTRFMAAGDQFTKKLNFDAVSHVALMEHGVSRGLEGAELARHVANGMENLTLDGGQAATLQNVRNALREMGYRGDAIDVEMDKIIEEIGYDFTKIVDPALEVAQHNAFTREMLPEEGAFRGMSKDLQQFTHRHPLLKPFLPFIRTPVNLLSYGEERTIDASAGMLRWLIDGMPSAADWHIKNPNIAGTKNKFVKDLLSGDEQRKAEAFGRLASGMGFTIAGIGWAMEGKITGGGPVDPHRRKILESTGWLANSIEINGEYYQYKRLDPFATLLGVWGDLADLSRYAEPEQQGEFENVITALTVSIGRNITGKTYLTGLEDLSGMFSNPADAIPRWSRKYAGAMVPMSGFLGQSSQTLTGDPTIYEVRSMLDAATAKVPFLRGMDLPIVGNRPDLQRNFMGEPLEKYMSAGIPGMERWTDWTWPIIHNTTSSSALNHELASLNHPFNRRSAVRYGQDWRDIKKEDGQSLYDYVGELATTAKHRGRTMRSNMARLINSPAYKKMSREGFGGQPSPRIQALQEIVRTHYAIAERDAIDAFPQLSPMKRNFRLIAKALASGRDPTAFVDKMYTA